MEEENIIETKQDNVEGETKTVRRRRKKIYQAILQQMEFYFSDANLNKDRYLHNLVKDDPYVDLSVFLKFNKIRALTDNVEDIANALSNSELLTISNDRTKVCRESPIRPNYNEDECSIYVENLPPDAKHEWLKDVFSVYGKVAYVSIPKYRQSGKIKGFAFVEFESQEVANRVLEAFGAAGCCLPSDMAPEQLCSVSTFEPGEGKNQVGYVEHPTKLETGDAEEIIGDPNEGDIKEEEGEGTKTESIATLSKKKKKRKKDQSDEEEERPDEEEEEKQSEKECPSPVSKRRKIKKEKDRVEEDNQLQEDNEEDDENANVPPTEERSSAPSKDKERRKRKKVEGDEEQLEDNEEDDENANVPPTEERSSAPSKDKEKRKRKKDEGDEEQLENNEEDDENANVPPTEERSSAPSKDKEKRKRKKDEGDEEQLEEPKKAKLEEESATEKENGEEQKEQKKKTRKKRNKNKKEKQADEAVGLHILSKREWKRLRNKYLALQRKNMKNLRKQIMGGRWGNYWGSDHGGDGEEMHHEEWDEENEKDVEHLEDHGTENSKVKEEKTKSCPRVQFTPGVIMKIQLKEPLESAKKFKTEVKNLPKSDAVAYVDAKDAASIVHIRCETAEGAKDLLEDLPWEDRDILEGEEEKEYWEKILKDRDEKITKKIRVKQRGRDRILRKAENLIGKHVRYEN